MPKTEPTPTIHERRDRRFISELSPGVVDVRIEEEADLGQAAAALREIAGKLEKEAG